MVNSTKKILLSSLSFTLCLFLTLCLFSYAFVSLKDREVTVEVVTIENSMSLDNPSQNDWVSDNYYSSYVFKNAFLLDSTYIYASSTSSAYYYDSVSNVWLPFIMPNISNFSNSNFWSDGVGYYYSGTVQYSLSFTNGTLSYATKTWNGLSAFAGQKIWSDGSHYFYYYNNTYYQLDISTSTWSTISISNTPSSFDVSNLKLIDGSLLYLGSYSTSYYFDYSNLTWSAVNSSSNAFYGQNVFNYGTDSYYIYNTNYLSFSYDVSTNTLTTSSISFTGLPSSNVYGMNTHTFNNNYYLNVGTNMYLFDSSNLSFSPVTFYSAFKLNSQYIWSDGTYYYFSNGNNQQYVLDTQNHLIYTKTWTGLTNIYGNYVWSDGTNYYYSSGTAQFVLNTLTSTWSTKTWTGLTNFYGNYVWSDGTNYYFSYATTQYVLDTSTSTWTAKSWTGLSNFTADGVWSDGTNIYYSNTNLQYVLDTSTSTWSQKIWSGALTSFSGQYVWSDGVDTFYSDINGNNYVFDSQNGAWTSKIWTGLSTFNGQYVKNINGSFIYADSTGTYKYTPSASSSSNVTIPPISFVYPDSSYIYSLLLTKNNTSVYFSPSIFYMTPVFSSDSFSFTDCYAVFHSQTGNTLLTIPFNVTFSDGTDIYSLASYSDLSTYYITLTFDLSQSIAGYSLDSGNTSTSLTLASSNFGFALSNPSAMSSFSPSILNVTNTQRTDNFGINANFIYTDSSNGYVFNIRVSYIDGSVINSVNAPKPYIVNLTSSGSSTSADYTLGYNAGFNDGEVYGYNQGYSNGVADGRISGRDDYIRDYVPGIRQFEYDQGYSAGYTDGESYGYNQGVESANNYSFFSLIGAVIDAPITALTGSYNSDTHEYNGGLLNFEVLGMNMRTFFLGLVTIAIALFIIRLALKGGN